MVRFQSVNDQNQRLSGSFGSTRTSRRHLQRAFPFSALSVLSGPHSCYPPGFVPYFLHPTRSLCPCGSSQDSEEAGKMSITGAGRTGRGVLMAPVQRVHGTRLEVSKQKCPITKPSNDPTGMQLPLWVMKMLRRVPVLPVSQEELVGCGAGIYDGIGTMVWWEQRLLVEESLRSIVLRHVGLSSSDGIQHLS